MLLANSKMTYPAAIIFVLVFPGPFSIWPYKCGLVLELDCYMCTKMLYPLRTIRYVILAQVDPTRLVLVLVPVHVFCLFVCFGFFLTFTFYVWCSGYYLGKENEHHYLVASQDPELRRELRAVPGVPLFHIIRNTMVLEKPTTSSEVKVQEVINWTTSI